MRTHCPKRTFVTTALTFFNLFQLGAGGHFRIGIPVKTRTCTVMETTISEIFIEFVLKLNALHKILSAAYHLKALDARNTMLAMS